MVKNLNTVERGEKVRIGKLQPHTQAENSVIVNASDTIVQAPHSGTFVSPIRYDTVATTNVLAYDTATNEIVTTQVVAVDKTLQYVTETGNTTTEVVQFTNGFVSPGPVGLAGNTEPSHSLDIGSNVYIDDTSSSGNVFFARGNVYIEGNLTTFGETTLIYSQNISVKDPIIELGQNNVNENLLYDLGVLMKRPGENVGVVYREAQDEVFVGYTPNTASERFITSSSNLVTMNVVGDVYANAYFGDGRTLTGVAFKAHLEDNVSRIEVLETDATSNALRVSNLETQMTSNGIRVGNLESNLAANSVRVSNLEFNLQNNSQRISTLTAYHTSNVLRIQDLEANVNTNVHTRLNNLESNLTDNSNRITTLSTRLEDNSFRISVNTANIANLQVTSSNNFANIALLQTYALSNSIRVSTLETSLQSNALLLNDVVSNLAANSARITALEVLPAQLVDNSARISALEVDPEFEGIITGDGGNISNLTLQYISDMGNTTSNTLHLTGDVSLKTDGFVGINVEPEYELHVGGDVQVDGNFNSTYFTTNGTLNRIYGNTIVEGNTTIEGNLVVHGATSYLYSENVFIRDPIIGLGNNGLADTGIIIGVQNPANVVFGYDASETEFIVAHSTASVDGVSLTPDPSNPINFHVYGDVEANTITTQADVVVGGNLEVRGNTTFLQVDNLAVDDAIIKIAAGNQLTTLDSGVVMERADANVAMVYRGHEDELMFAYTTDDAAGVDITPDLSKHMNVHVYGSFFADKSINVNSNTFISETGAVTANIYFGDGGLLSNITQTLQGITDIGNTTTQTLLLTNTNEAINAVANIVSDGYYFGNGEFLTGISNAVTTNTLLASNLETVRTYISSNVNILNENISSNLSTVRDYITSNVNILNENISSNLSTTRDYITSNVNILNENISSNLSTTRDYITSNVNILNDNISSNLSTARTYISSNVNILNDNISSNLSTVRDYISSNVNILNENISTNLETTRTYITSNVNILNDNISSNLSTVRTYISSNVNILNENISSNLSTTRDYISSNVEILNDNISSNLSTARTYITSNVNILNDNISSNLSTARDYISSNVNILNDNIRSNVDVLNDNISSNLETTRTYISSNVNILNDNISSNLSTTRDYISSNVNILNDNISSNLGTTRTYITSNVNILNDNISSNLSTTRDYISSNVEILNDNISSNLSTTRTYITSNVDILNDNISSNLSTVRDYISSNVNILNDNISSNLSTTRDYITSNVEILNDNISTNLETTRTYITSNVNILNDNIDSNLSTARDYITSNVNILNDNISSNLSTARDYISSNVSILNDNISTNLETTRTYITSNVNILNDNISTNLETVRTYMTDNVQILNDYIALKSNILDPTFTSNITVTSNVTTSELAVSTLTAGRVPYVGTDSFLVDHEHLTFTQGSPSVLSVGGDVNVSGNLKVQGSTTFLHTTNTIINDAIIELANNNTSDTIDMGFIMTRPSSNVGVGYRGDESEFMIGHTLSDPSGSDLAPDTGNEIALHVYGSVDVDTTLAVDTDTLYVNATDDRVGVNTTTPGVSLDVRGDANVAALSAHSNVDIGTDDFFVDTNSGRVGIGTTLPIFELDVSGDANVNTLNVYTIQGLQTLAFSSDNTTTPPLQLTAGSLNDGIGALRIDSVEPDIYLNDTNGGFATVTFANNDVSRAAFGRNSGDDFYITVRDPAVDSGNWKDTTLVVDSSTGNITTGYKLGVNTTSFTGSNVLEVGGTANAVAYWGDGGLLSNIASTLDDVCLNGNTTTQVVSLLNTHTALTTDLTSNVGVKLNQLANVVIDTDLTAEQRLIYDGTNWVNDFNDNNFIRVINKTGFDIAKGNTLYIVDSHNNNVANVALAKSDDPSTMPCIGVASDIIANDTEGLAVTYGKVSGVNTVGFSKGQTVYVSNTVAGGVMETKPFDIENEVDQIQNLGIVIKEDSQNNGIIFITGIGRSNDIPNANIVTQNSQLNYVYVNNVNNDMLKIDPTNLLTKLQTLQQVTDTEATTTNEVSFTNTGTWSLKASGNIYATSNVTALEYYGDGTKLDGVALKTDLTSNAARVSVLEANVVDLWDNVYSNASRVGVLESNVVDLWDNVYSNAARIGVLEANVVDLWDNVYSNATTLATLKTDHEDNVVRVGVLEANVVDLWDNVYSNASTLATLKTDHEDNVVRIGVLEANVVDLWDNVYSNASTLATLKTDHEDNVVRIGVLEANVVDLWDNVYSNATTLATLKTDHEDNVVRIGVLEANVIDLWDNVYSNATTLATLKTDHEDNVARIDVLEANVVDLWDNVYSNAARLDTAEDDISDLENTRATKLDPTFTSNITVSNVAYVSNGLVVNNTRFYAHSGSMTNPSDTIGLEFASNIFYARVMAQLIYDTEDVNTLVLELQGGKLTGTPTKNITVGTLNKFGDTVKPWSSTVTTTATEVTIQPSDLNQDYEYELMVEYTSAGTDSKLVAVKEGSTAVKNFAY
jgi:hypothetical protein